MNKDLMFSSDTGEWDTDQSVVNNLATEFKWDLDICASRPNVCETYFNEAQDAFKYDWSVYPLRWINPPYGRGMDKWIKQVATIETGVTVCLLPARTDTAMWQKYIPQASQVTFIKGRLKFGSDESWIERYYNVISDGAKPRKTRLDALKKIGGKYFQEDELSGENNIGLSFLDKVFLLTNGANFDIDKWLRSDKLHKDSAPFPSAFVVFGKINDDQSNLLASYGWTVFS